MSDDKIAITNGICNEASAAEKEEQRTWSSMLDDIIWADFLRVIILHLGFTVSLIIYGNKIWRGEAKYLTIIWVFVVAYVSAIGTAAGVHRLWSHRSFKAKWPLRLIFTIFYSTAGMNPIFNWAKDHRVHHKYSETNADPYNINRGFFFAHVGWLMMKKHPDCTKRGKEMDVRDLKADAFVMFEKKHHFQMKVLFCWLIPAAIPVLCWGENMNDAIMTQIFIRYVFYLNGVWCINSVAHTWGSRPYNSSIKSVENLMAIIVTAGEGWHNYHHTFPWDYKTAELPHYSLNYSTVFIDICAKIGWAYDLKEATPELIEKVTKRLRLINGTKSV